jgi:hypothetical protein
VVDEQAEQSAAGLIWTICFCEKAISARISTVLNKINPRHNHLASSGNLDYNKCMRARYHDKPASQQEARAIKPVALGYHLSQINC